MMPVKETRKVEWLESKGAGPWGAEWVDLGFKCHVTRWWRMTYLQARDWDRLIAVNTVTRIGRASEGPLWWRDWEKREGWGLLKRKVHFSDVLRALGMSGGPTIICSCALGASGSFLDLTLRGQSFSFDTVLFNFFLKCISCKNI